MNTKDLSQNALDWMAAIEVSPFDWVDGLLETMLDHDCVSENEKAVILRRYQSLLN